MSGENKNIKDMSDKKIQKALDKIFDVWEMTNEVFSLTDLIELVREQTKREYNV